MDTVMVMEKGSRTERVLIVDDQTFFCHLAREILSKCDRFSVVGESYGGEQASGGPHHQDSGEAKIRESTAGVSRKPSSDCEACGCSSKHLCGLTAWNT